MTVRNALLERFGNVGGELAIGGEPLSIVAARAGSTPFFAYDRRLLHERVAELRAALPSEVQLSYAVKANPMPAVVQCLSGIVDRFDVASAREMLTALDTDTPARRVSFAGPGKTAAELSQAVAAGVTIELESEGEADRVIAAGAAVGRRPRVAVRVNPAFEVKGSGMRMGGGPQQFGVDAEVAPQLISRLLRSDVEFVGLHVFAGSQNLRADILASSQRQTAELIVQLADGAGVALSYVNLGGGFGIPYFETDVPLDLSAVGQSLHSVVDEVLRPALPSADIVVELGRYIVGEAGVYVTRVVDRKVSRGKTFLVVDGGLHHQLAASGNFGQVIRRNYPVVVGNRLDAPTDDVASVVGCSCTPLDILGADVALPHAEPGDLIAIFQAGAYGLTASPTAFLSHPDAVEMLV